MEFTPHSDQQEQVLFAEEPIVVAATGIQWGKGVPLDQEVLTPNGYVAAGSLKVGDTLYDRMGQPTKIVGVFPQGIMPCYRINLTNGYSFITDESHLNCVIPRCGRPERVMSTKDLFEAKHLWKLARIPSLEGPILMPEGKFVISPYIMGVLLGDGGIHSSIMVSSADQEILDRISQELPADMHLVFNQNYDYRITHKSRKTNAKGYGFNAFKAEFKRLGLVGKMAHEKFVPQEYKYSSVYQRLDVLRGLMDTDAYVVKNRRMEFYSTSKKLADDVIWLVESLGGKAWIRPTVQKPTYTHNGETRIGRESYRVNVILRKFNPFWLPRKASEYFCHENTEDKVIDSVVPVEPCETVCFKVDSPTSTFVIKDQVVTHNTSSGALWLKMMMHQFTHPEDNFILTSPSYPILSQSTLPPFLRYMAGWGKHDKKDNCFRMHKGGTCWFRTGTNPDSVVGITNVRAILCDEAGLYSLYFWENIQARASFKKAPIRIVTSPYSLNWLYKEIIRVKAKDPTARPDVRLIQASSKDNPYFPEDEYERKRLTMDPIRFQMMYGGGWGRMEGLVYKCYDERENRIEPFQLPRGTRIFAGVDWGYTHPFVIKVRAITPTGMHFSIGEFYKTGLTIAKKVDAARMLRQVHNIELFYADPANPDDILAFNEAGLPCVPAENAIRKGIDAHYELIATRRYKIFVGTSPYTEDELEVYHYPEPKDDKPDKDDKEALPVDKDNHCMDADRYVSIMTRHLVEPEVVIHPDKDFAQMERLKKLYSPSSNPNTESWG